MSAGSAGSELYRSEILAVVNRGRSKERRSILYIVAGAAAVALSLVYCNAVNLQPYVGALDRFAAIVAEAFPPDFTRWRSWIVPLFETLAMSVASTAISALIALEIGRASCRERV